VNKDGLAAITLQLDYTYTDHNLPATINESIAGTPSASVTFTYDDRGRLIHEVRSLIEEYNGLVDDESYDELAGYYVEAQREAVGSLVTLTKDALAKVNALGDALKGALPDEEDRVAGLLDTLTASSSLKLAVSSLAVAGEEEVTGALPSLPGMPATIRFRLMEADGETNWYIDSPVVAMASAMKPMIEAQLASWDQVIQAVQADPSTAEQMLQSLETAANMAKTMSGDSEDGG
jgi:hypothetical protein